MTAPASATGPCPGALRPLASRWLSPVRLRLLAPVPAGRRLVLGVPDALEWRRRGSEVAFTPWPAYRRVYLIAIVGLAFVILGGPLGFAIVRRRAREAAAAQPPAGSTVGPGERELEADPARSR